MRQARREGGVRESRAAAGEPHRGPDQTDLSINGARSRLRAAPWSKSRGEASAESGFERARSWHFRTPHHRPMSKSKEAAAMPSKDETAKWLGHGVSNGRGACGRARDPSEPP